MAKLLSLAAIAAALGFGSVANAADRPNILLILADNLGYGEIGVYGGGETRGAPTPRIDELAAQGTRSAKDRDRAAAQTTSAQVSEARKLASEVRPATP